MKRLFGLSQPGTFRVGITQINIIIMDHTEHHSENTDNSTSPNSINRFKYIVMVLGGIIVLSFIIYHLVLPLREKAQKEDAAKNTNQTQLVKVTGPLVMTLPPAGCTFDLTTTKCNIFSKGLVRVTDGHDTVMLNGNDMPEEDSIFTRIQVLIVTPVDSGAQIIFSPATN